MEERKLTCIGCPMGCPLTVVMNGKEVVGVTGNTCKQFREDMRDIIYRRH